MKGRHGCNKKLGSGAAAVWLLLPLLVLIVLKTDFLPQVAHHRETSLTKVADEMVHKVSSLGLDSARWQQQPLDVANLEAAHDSVVGPPPSPASSDEMAGNVDANEDSKTQKQILAMNGTKDSTLLNSDVAPPRSNLTCNFSSSLMSICVMEGDVRIHGKSATVYVVSSSDYRPENATIMIRPYPRKWEQPTMERVREVTIRSSAPAATDIIPPRCTVAHDVPAVVFSTGGYSMNFFHAMNDIVIPLYITAREYDGRVQLLATDYDPKWMAKYRTILAALSFYPVIDLDADTAVRCFPSAHVGVESHKVLGIDPGLSRNGYTMMGFRDFLLSAYSLKRPSVSPISRSSGQRPRLVMVLRRRSRALTNEAEAVATTTGIGFEVVSAGPEDVRDMARFAEVVNSCDVMVGVHGAGLTNMVFLPHNGTIVQIIPWGGMKWPSWHDYGQPVPGMGLRYVEYEVTADETTLKERYPRDHAVFTDPISIHRQGFNNLWATFLNGQNVTLDMDRFRELMQQVYQSITTE